MRGALLLNSERPPTLRDLKTALLTYDTVSLVDPADRDLFPSNAFLLAMSGSAAVGVSWPQSHSIRELGKAPGYDDDFGKLVEDAAPAFSRSSAGGSRVSTSGLAAM